MITPEQMAFDAAAIPTIMANVKVLKSYLPKGNNAKKWTAMLPVASIAIAILYAIFLRPGCDWANARECVVAGFTIGMTCCGISAGARHTAEAFQKKT